MSARWIAAVAMLVSLEIAASAAAGPGAQGEDGLLADLQKIIDAGGGKPARLLQSVQARIEADPAGSARLVVPKLRDPQASEAALKVYVWAIGLTNQAETADDLIGLANARAKDAPRLMQECRRALANVGGPRAGAFLLGQVTAGVAPQKRFELLNLLGQMQYEPALPAMLELLKMDRRDYRKALLLVFGKMGDAAVPALIKQVDSDQPDVRFNAVSTLGWLIPPAAAAPLQARFWREEDAEIRIGILGALEGTLRDPSTVRQFSLDVLAKEKDEKVRQFAQETLDNLVEAEGRINELRAGKRDDRKAFVSCYAEWYHSAGKQGSFETLRKVSATADEPRLKKLRERILQRDSDMALYEYEGINEIIIENRWADAASAQTRPATAPSTP